MKSIAILFAALMVCSAIDFETFQEALNWDPHTFGQPNCPIDDEFTQTIASYTSWAAFVYDGQYDMEDDYDILMLAKEKIEEAKHFLGELDKGNNIKLFREFEELKQKNNEPKETKTEDTTDETTTEETTEETTDETTTEETTTEETTTEETTTEETKTEPEHHTEDTHDDNDDGDVDVFGWGEGEVPQMHHHKHKSHAHSFIQVIRNVNALKLKAKAKKIIAMAQELDGDSSNQRKFELCDLIIAELDEMINQLDLILNDEQYQEDSVKTFNEKKEQLIEVAKECNAHILDLEDGSFISKKSTETKKQLKHKISKSKHHQKEVSFLQINQIFEDDVAESRVAQQKEILQNQGMLGFLRNSGKRLKIMQMD